MAVYRGHNAVVELLIEKGKAKVNKTDEDGDTLVHIVAIKLESFGDEPNPKTSPNIFEVIDNYFLSPFYYLYFSSFRFTVN